MPEHQRVEKNENIAKIPNAFGIILKSFRSDTIYGIDYQFPFLTGSAQLF